MDKAVRVLFVEDEEKDVALSVRELERGGFKVTSKRVDSAESMIASLNEGGFDIILSDHTMPRFSAPAALEILKQSGIKLPFIIVSGTLRAEVAVAIMRNGAQDYVDKGDLSRLAAIVERELLESEKRRNERELLNVSNTLLKEAYHLAHIGGWDWLMENDTVIWTEELYEIAGRDISLPAPTYAEQQRIYTPASWEKLVRAVKNALTSGETYNLELELVLPDGSIRWTNAIGGVKRDAGGKILGLHGTLQDINDRKHIESELEQKTAEAIASEQKAMIYFDFLAHDMANILSPMMIYADIIKLKPNDPAEVLKFINKTHEQVKRAAALIYNLRRLESVDKLHPNEIDVIDLRTLFSAMDDNIRSAFPNKAIEMSYDIPDVESMAVKGGEWMQQVFHCIYDNAVRHSVNSTVKLDIKASMQQEGKQDYWLIEVSDNGPGISNKLKKHYSASIVNSKEGFKGVASSIPFCISFMRCIGGEMLIGDRIDGDPTQGTKITIRLPRGE